MAMAPMSQITLLPNMLVTADLDAGRVTHVLPNYRSEGGDVSVLLPSREQAPLPYRRS